MLDHELNEVEIEDFRHDFLECHDDMKKRLRKWFTFENVYEKLWVHDFHV